MPETQPTPANLDPAAQSSRREEFVLHVLLDDDNHRPIAIEELVREVGDHRDALDGLAGLCRAGLAHRLKTDTGEFVFASRAAMHFFETTGQAL
jgi:hypothetical protein